MLRIYCVILFLMIGVTGCTTRPSQAPQESMEKEKRTDPWSEAAAILRRQPDLGGARQSISLLSKELADHPTETIPSAMPDDQLKDLSQRLRLTADESKDLGGSNFTNLDAAYLAECLILRDAVRSLDLGQLPMEMKIRLVFDWVCRQVYLKPGRMITGNGQIISPPLPPQYAIYRGFGHGIDRVYLFLAMLQQLGVDACLIGPPGQETARSVNYVENRIVEGPFWAVGCQVSDQKILLFDPWRGEPIPGPNQTIGTLAQALEYADPIRTWNTDKSNQRTITEKDIKSATAYAATPYSACSLRMKLMEEKIGQELGIRLYHDIESLRLKFGPNARIWSPAASDDPFCLTRVRPSFLPIEEGGTNNPPERTLRLYEQLTNISTVPMQLFQPPPRINQPEVKNALGEIFRRRFLDVVLSTNPRERIARGQYNDVIRTMVSKERMIGISRDRARLAKASDDEIASWADHANDLYEKLARARLPQNVANLPDAQAAVEKMWQSGGPIIQMIDDQMTMPVCAAEISYILAVCKHEQAERASIRVLRSADKSAAKADAKSAARQSWLVADDAWKRYFAASESFQAADPERLSHVRKMAAIASKQSREPSEK